VDSTSCSQSEAVVVVPSAIELRPQGAEYPAKSGSSSSSVPSGRLQHDLAGDQLTMSTQGFQV
jgi:hypothetical protein